MATEIITSFDQQCDANGDPMSGAKVYVYDVGSTTPKTVYSNAGLSSSAANPIVCDSAGRHDMRYIATGSYKIVVKTSADVTVYTRDNIDGRVPVGAGALAVANGGTGATSAGAALTNLGAASDADVTDLAADVAALVSAAGSTEKSHIATGTTAQRPVSPAEGDFRRNTTTSRWEGYVAAWEQFFTDTEIASQAQMETATSTAVVVTPGRVQNHPGVAKAWALVTFSAGTPSIAAGHNAASVTDNGNGDTTVTFTTAFSSTSYAANATLHGSGSNDAGIYISALATDSVRVVTYTVGVSGANTTRTSTDLNFTVVCFGDQ